MFSFSQGRGYHQDDYHIETIDKKVTIILLISFQPSYKKADKDLYNPI